jgi:hypothetical protein
VGSVEKRIQALERLGGGGEPVRIVVKCEGEEEPLYSFILKPPEDKDHTLREAPEREDGWEA